MQTPAFELLLPEKEDSMAGSMGKTHIGEAVIVIYYILEVSSSFIAIISVIVRLCLVVLLVDQTLHIISQVCEPVSIVPCSSNCTTMFSSASFPGYHWGYVRPFVI